MNWEWHRVACRRRRLINIQKPAQAGGDKSAAADAPVAEQQQLRLCC